MMWPELSLPVSNYLWLKNAAKDDDPQLYDVMLLYPTVHDEPLDFQYEIHGHRLSIRSINLNQDWKKNSTRYIESVES